MKSVFIPNGSGQLHTLQQEGNRTPLILMVPGMFGIAEHFSDEFEHFKDFPLVAISLRGRGQSLQHFESFTFEDHVSDVIAAIETRSEDKIVLMGHSFGCLVAVAAAVASPKVTGLVLIDKGLSQNKISERWLDYVRQSPPETSTFEIASKIYRDSRAIDLKQDFIQANRPTLFFKGVLDGHMLKDEEVCELGQIPKTRVVRLPQSSHSPSPVDYPLFREETTRFLESLSSL